MQRTVVGGTIPRSLLHPSQPDGGKLAYWTKKGLCGTTFASDWGELVLPGPLTIAKWRATATPPKFPTPEEAQQLAPSVDAVNLTALKAPPRDAVQSTWMGHASFLVQVEGINVLTDPVWSERCAPVQFAGPKRYVPPPAQLAELPLIDVVTISHNHYDHLDLATVKELIRLFDPVFVVPLGMKAWFKNVVTDYDVEAHVRELDWWDCTTIQVRRATMHVSAVPVQHWTMRTGPWDRNTELWCGFVYEVPTSLAAEPVPPADDAVSKSPYVWRMFHCGDTGYSDRVFKQIGQVFGEFDFAMIPIGAYEPRWVMSAQHVDPKEAVAIHADLNRPRLSVGMHWGTFILTDEPIDEPPKELAVQLATANLPPSEFVALKHGETVTVFVDRVVLDRAS